MINQPLFCAVEKCPPVRGSHLAHVGHRDDCPGCQPRLAEPGSAVCTACRLRLSDRLAELPGLYLALLRPSKVANINGGGTSGHAAPAPLPATAIDARADVRALAASWCTAFSGFAGVTAQLRQIEQSRGRLLADPIQGPTLVDAVDKVWTEASRVAFPAPPDGVLIGECPVGVPEGEGGRCGGQVRTVVEGQDVELGWATCRKCKTGGVIGWWLAAMPIGTVKWMGMRALRWHLALVTGRQVTEHTVRGWARNGELDTSWTDGEHRVDPAVNDERLAGFRIEYLTSQAVDLAKLGRGRGRPKSA